MRPAAPGRSSPLPAPPRTTRLLLLGLIAVALLEVPQPPALARRGLGANLVEPTFLRSQNGVLEATLVQKPDVTVVTGLPVQDVWTYHVGEDGPPNYSGPTLYVQPGDTLRLKIVNRLPPSIGPRQVDLVPVPTPTNLHVHGMHVSPLGNADNVLLDIPPDGASNQYEIKIPKDHPQGLYWYHPHRHMFAREQLLRGLAGLLVVGRPDGGAPQLNGVRQRLLVLQYSVIQPLLGGGPTMLRNASFAGAPPLVHFTVNGQENPSIDIRPGELQVWNLCNASHNGYFYLRIKGVNGTTDQPIVAIAQDGNPYTRPVTYPATKPLLIPSGARFSLLVQGPPAGSYQIEMVPFHDGFVWWPTSPSAVFLGDNLPEARTLATIVSGGEPVRPPSIPSKLTPPANYFEGLERLPVDYRRAVEYSAIFEGPPDNLTNVIFTINGAPFPRNPLFQPRLNTVEEWTVTNTTIDDHPFHPHQNDFQVLSVEDATNPKNNFSTPQPWVQDIIHLPAAVTFGDRGQLNRPSTVVVRTHFRDFLGTYVHHCHRVDHEDRGQMAIITTIPELPIYAAGAGAGSPPVVKVYSSLTNQQVAKFTPLAPGFRGGVRVAVGDVNQDTIMDVLAVPGPGGNSRVRVMSGKGGFTRQLFNLRAFDEAFPGGLNVAAGDINADGYDDMIVAPAGGGPPEVRIFSGKDGSRIGSFLAYEAGFQGGVSLAAAMVAGTGRNSIITGPGPGRAPEVKVFDVDWYGQGVLAATADAKCRCKKGQCACGERQCACSAGRCECSRKPVTTLAISGDGTRPLVQTAAGLAYEPEFLGGVNVGTGPVDGQNGGFAAILTGPASNHPPLVKYFVLKSYAGHEAEPPSLLEVAAVEAFPPSATGGVWVSSVSTPEGADLLASLGPDQPPALKRLRFKAIFPVPPGTLPPGPPDPRLRPVPGIFRELVAFDAFGANTRGTVVGGR
jgi:FtsP/CotA-like multicopper oxidase with cupredoxin domain